MRLEYTWGMDEDCEAISHNKQENNQTSSSKHGHFLVNICLALERRT
jgi:hypothetical protein